MNSPFQRWWADEEATTSNDATHSTTPSEKRVALGSHATHAPPWALPGLLAIASVMTMIAFIQEPPGYSINVAFVGNSMQYVNDLPRFMQALAGKKRVNPKALSLIYQNSVLHGTVNFKTQFQYGNGMYIKWKSEKAEISEQDTNNDIFDFGACSVKQLVLGYDENLNDYSNYFKNDGKNACFMSEAYYNYSIQHFEDNYVEWDYVVLNDNTKWPAIEEKKEASLEVLEDTWVPMLQESGATVVLYATHGYRSDVINVTGMGNVSSFTSDVFEGYRQYAELLSLYLPDDQQPRIAPVGLAFLVVYEEDHDMWRNLFYIDGVHPSPHGSYLMGCVLYATLYGHMPRRSVSLPPKPKTLWRRARRMETNSRFYMSYPSHTDAAYLYGVAQRVMMQHYRPETWIQYYDEATDNDFIGNWR